MTPGRMTMGKDAVVSCLCRFLHPRQVMATHFANADKNLRLENLCVRRRETKKIRGNDVMCLIVVSQALVHDGEPVELHAVERNFKILIEGPSDFFFEAPVAEDQQDDPGEEMLPIEVRAMFAQCTVDAADAAELDGIVEIDDDNEAAPENVVAEGEQVEDVFEREWGHTGVCYRRAAGFGITCAELGFPPEVKPTLQQMFEYFFPKRHLVNVVLSSLNNTLRPLVTYGELLRWIGLWFVMATQQGAERPDFWSTAPVDMFSCANFCLSEFMSQNRFEEILRHISYTSREAPNPRDPFFPIRDLIDAWNKNMADKFTPSWAVVVDKSMSVWRNEYTCPGFMVSPRKPWPFGNVYHTACCGVSGIMFRVELMEGKNVGREYDELGKTVGLLLRMTKPVWNTGKVIILDSGFCVLKGVIELKRRGLYAAALVKKRQYWPKYIRGDDIKAHFEGKEVGTAEAWPGELDGIPFHLYCMKEPNFVMTLMSTYGTLKSSGKVTSRACVDDDGVKRKKSVAYTEVIHNHCKYRHLVDDHNARRHSPISLEVVWATKWWPNHVFAFLLAITEVNCHLGMNHFYSAEFKSTLEFRKSFAEALIKNSYLEEEMQEDLHQSPINVVPKEHGVFRLPAGKKFSGAQVVDAKSSAPQCRCIGCKKKTRTSCTCSLGVYRCVDCILTHVAEVKTQL